MLSMTGFGTASSHGEGCSVFVELKTVNNRFLKLTHRLNDTYSSLEPKIEGVIREKITRGTVNVLVKIRREITNADSQINETLLVKYYEQLKRIGERIGRNDEPILDAILRLPGVVSEQSDEDDSLNAVWKTTEKTLREALQNLQRMREVEGASMERDLIENIAQLEDSVAKIEVLAPKVADNFRERLSERVGKIMAEHQLTLEPADLVREVAIYSDRCDISEEIVRFKSHIQQVRETLQKGDNCGKKLDFLTQELFRETNTIGSKANDAGITKNVVEMKSAIEKIREMVQNIE